MMTLYYSPGACSLSPHIVLREASIDFKLEKVDLATKKMSNGKDFTKVSAKGQVPVLQLDNGELLTEGAVIAQYVADRNPQAGLLPAAGSMERYRVQEWLNYIAAELHKSFSPLFNPASSEEGKRMAKSAIAARFGYVDKHLAGKQYLLGDHFTVADAYCFTIATWTKPVGIDTKPWPNLQAYMMRVASRPKVLEAMRAEGLLN